MKKLYFAPFEGITGYIYRNVHHKYFGNTDRYYTPFLVTNEIGKLKSKELRDILPENNKNIVAIPQILSNHAEQLIRMAGFLKEYGYEEINLNLGCPARTVVSKKRGSGLLADLDNLDRFLDEVCDGIPTKLSLKTRIGLESPEEFESILEIFNQYPIAELIIHPRLQKDFYKNTPNREVFQMAVKKSRNPLCYNGDIFTVGDYKQAVSEFPEVNAFMLGRGLLRNPDLANEIRNGKSSDKNTFKAFYDELCMGYQEIMSGDRNVLFKMKEVWFYLGQSFEHADKYLKMIRKANKLTEYQDAVERIFQECNLVS